MKPRRLNFFAGPGTGKSTLATGVFSALKMLGVNVEYVSEYAKDATWENRGEKVFKAQEYIFGKQNFRQTRLDGEVAFTITDSPILMARAYIQEKYFLPSLHKVINEAHAVADNLDIFIVRTKSYNPKGRNQTEDQAKVIDQQIIDLLEESSPGYLMMNYGRECVDDVILKLMQLGWINPFTEDQLDELTGYHQNALCLYQNLKTIGITS